MLLALDVGNSQIFGGVFDGDELKFRFRKGSSGETTSSDEYGVFLRQVLRENDFDPQNIEQVAICSVVPERVHSLKNCCKKYFGFDPFVLQAGVKTGLKIKYRNPVEVGADRIADAVGATHLYPDQDIIVIDFGTATTVEVISRQKEFLGGAILPGVRMSMEVLEKKTSRLPTVEIVPAENVVGRSTTESIQAGLFYGHLGALKEIVAHTCKQAFGDNKPLVIGTGGFATLFDGSGIFDVEEPDLVLKGLYLVNSLNQEGGAK